MDPKPLTPADVREVVFDKAPRGKRGYNEKQVDDFLDRIEATLAGTDSLTAEEVSSVVFEDAPLIKRGYHEEQVDAFLDAVVDTLERLERAGAERAAAAARRAAAARPAPTEQTVPMAFAQPPSLPADDPAPATEPLAPDRQPADLLSLPLPPAPPGARGYRPGDVEKLARLLLAAIDEPDGPTSADLMRVKLTKTFFNGQGYHIGAVDALLEAWIEELRHQEG